MRVRLIPLLVVALAALCLGAAPARDPGTTITVDGGSGGRTFDGVGALSAGASSRLLVDYPEPERSRVLDYLFKPGYGAALQILKVEIGGDTNSTDGAEPSHMRTPSDLNCARGYEWWLMEQAKARNPDIKLSALQWGAPGWTGTGGDAPTVWTDHNIDYLVSWLGCAKSRGLHIDEIGGWNERGYDAGWYTRLRAALDAHGFARVKIVADDSWNWTVVDGMAADADFRNAVGAVGEHYVCGYLTAYTSCPSPAAAQALGKPLYASEQGSLPYDTGAAPLARAMNRQYIDGAMTSTINWSLISAWYDTMPFQASGLMGAVEPWSGAYVVGPSVWAVAQTTQFTRVGWRYADSAKGRLPDGGSYVAMRSPDGRDYTVVAETTDATGPQNVTLNVAGGLPHGAVHQWSTDLTTNKASGRATGGWFVRGGDVRPGSTVTLRPGRVYTFSTMTGGKGRAVSPPAKPQALPYGDGFEKYATGATPRYISDLDGAFEVRPCTGRAGNCLKQMITDQPVWWNGWLKRPVTLVGDPKSWRDYDTSALARPADGGWTELLGRVDGQYASAVSGVHLRLASDGTWRLYDENLRGQDGDLCRPSDPSCAKSAPKTRKAVEKTLATGRVPAAGTGWHRLGMTFSGTTVTAKLDGHQIAQVTDDAHVSGQTGLGVSPWTTGEFDDLKVSPVAATGPVRWLPAQDLSATATSAHQGYEPRKAIDGSVQSMWHTEYSPPSGLPQSITVDTGAVRNLARLTYQPREDGNGNGVITRYSLESSRDGRTFTPVTTGTWPADATRKTIDLTGTTARYLRLTAQDGGGSYASAAELQVAVPR